jgi:osmotically-inducible protein OsmY
MMPFSRRSRRRPFRTLLVIAVGTAVAVYLFDPQRGRTRRAKLRDKAGAWVRRGSRELERRGRYFGAKAYGLKERAAHVGAEEVVPPNDQALAAKVESEVLGRSTYPKGKVNVNVEHGVVVLRGELEDETQISELEQDVRKITGVLDVRNLLHLPGQSPPNK